MAPPTARVSACATGKPVRARGRLKKMMKLRLKTHLSPERLRFLSDNVDESESLSGKTGSEGSFGGFCGAHGMATESERKFPRPHAKSRSEKLMKCERKWGRRRLVLHLRAQCLENHVMGGQSQRGRRHYITSHQ